jgi:hypothetical protein
MAVLSKWLAISQKHCGVITLMIPLQPLNLKKEKKGSESEL